MIKRINVPTGMALAFVNAAAKDLNNQTQVDHRRWVARHVADRVEHTKIGVNSIKSTKINGK